ncbi:hypothetical protein ACR6C2_10060 [Streptomyces sp. INA 01156]
MRTATVRAATLSTLLAATLALLPVTAAHADGIRARQWGLDALHTQEAWRTTQGDGVVVAVLDTGVDADHPTSPATSSRARTWSASAPNPATAPGPGTAPPWRASSPVTDTAPGTPRVSWASRRSEDPPCPGDPGGR